MTSYLDENKYSSKNAVSESKRLDIPMISWSLPIISSGEETPDNLDEDQAQHSPIIGKFDGGVTSSPSLSRGKGSDVKEVSVKIALVEFPPHSCGQPWDQMIDNVLEEDKRLSQVSVDLFSDVTEFDLDNALEESFVVPPNQNTRFDDSFQESTACEQPARNQGNISDTDICVAPPNKVTRLDDNLWLPISAGKVQHVKDASYVTRQLGSQEGINPPIGMDKAQGDISKMSAIRIYSTSSVDNHSTLENNTSSMCKKPRQVRRVKLQKGKANSEESKTPDFIIDSSYTVNDHTSFQNNHLSTSQKIRKPFCVNKPLKNKHQSKESNTSDFIIDSTYPLDDQISFQKNPKSKCQKVRKSSRGNKPQKGKAQTEKSKKSDSVIDSSSHVDDCRSFKNDHSSTCENLTIVSVFNKTQKGKGQREVRAIKNDLTCTSSLQNKLSSVCEKLSKSRLLNKLQKAKAPQTPSTRIYPMCPMSNQMVARSKENSSFNQKEHSNNSESRQTHKSYWLRSQSRVVEPLRRQTLLDVTSLNLPSRAEFIPDPDLPPGFWEDPDAEWPQEWVDDLQRFDESF